MTRFQDLHAITPADLDAAIVRNDPDELLLVPITAALLAEEPSLAVGACVRLSRHCLSGIRANAVVSLGHLARRIRSLDERLVRPVEPRQQELVALVNNATSRSGPDESGSRPRDHRKGAPG
ncbi:MAG: hypothetical protein ACYC7L_17655 [Nitrospirota bacterium]